MVATHLAAAAFCFLVAVPVLFASQHIREFGYDVMGGRAFPMGLALILIGLGLAKCVVACRAAGMAGWRSRRTQADRAPGPDRTKPALEREKLVVVAASVVYAGLLLFRAGDFILLSALYIAAAGALGRLSGRASLHALGMAATVVVVLYGMRVFLGMKMIAG